MQAVRGVPIESEVVAEPRDKAVGDGTGWCISAGIRMAICMLTLAYLQNLLGQL